jgi:hypothetical protein
LFGTRAEPAYFPAALVAELNPVRQPQHPAGGAVVDEGRQGGFRCDLGVG